MEDVIRQDGRYPLEAYEFLHEGLGRSVKDAYGEQAGERETPPGQRHVTGQQMCEGLQTVAIERWGLLARMVLGRWRIHSTLDFGNMVYLLINGGFMRKTDEDSLEDFRDVFAFEDAFDVPAEFELKE